MSESNFEPFIKHFIFEIVKWKCDRLIIFGVELVAKLEEVVIEYSDVTMRVISKIFDYTRRG